MYEMVRAGMDTAIGLENFFDNLDDALKKAREVVGSPDENEVALAPVEAEELHLPGSHPTSTLMK